MQNFPISSKILVKKKSVQGKSQHRIKTFMEIFWEFGGGLENKDIVIPTSPDFISPFLPSTVHCQNFDHQHWLTAQILLIIVLYLFLYFLYFWLSFFSSKQNAPFLRSSSPIMSFVTNDEQSLNSQLG